MLTRHVKAYSQSVSSLIVCRRQKFLTKFMNIDNSVCSSVLGCARRDLNDLIWLIRLFIFSLVSVSCLLSFVFVFFLCCHWMTNKVVYIAVPVRKLSVYLQPFHRSSIARKKKWWNFVAVHSWSVRCSQISQKSIKKTPYFGSSGTFKVIYVDTTEKLVTSACCDRQHAMPICNHFSRKLANNGKKQLLRGYHSLMPSCQVSLNLENRDLDRQNQRSMLKISYAAC